MDNHLQWIGLALIIGFLMLKALRKKQMKPLIEQYLAHNAIIVDVRTPQEFNQEHCLNSLNIPLNLLESRYTELDQNQNIILCCASGGRSGMALSFLKSKGYNKIINAGSWTNVKK